MPKQMKGLLYFLMTNFRYNLVIFWSILTGILLISLFISYLLLNVDDAVFGFGFPFATYFQAGIFGFIIVKEIIPYALKLGAVRRNVYFTIGLFFLGVAVLQSVIANTLQSLIEIFADAAGLHPFMFIHPVMLLSDNNWLTRAVIDISFIFLLLVVFFILGLLFYRGGMLVGGGFAGVVFILLLLGLALGWITDYFIELYYTIDLMFFGQLFLIAIVLYAISYLLIRRITTVKAR